MPKIDTDAKPPIPIREMVIGPKTVGEWDTEWQRLDGDFNVTQTCVNKTVGLYRAVDGNNTMAIGQAIEFQNGALRKRISDFRRKCESNSKGFMGEYIRDNRISLKLFVLCVGDNEEAAKLTIDLKEAMLKLYNPPKNASELTIRRAISQRQKK